MKTLDRNRPFGKISGTLAEFPGARFEQDGMYFRMDGSPCSQAGSAPAEAPTESQPLDDVAQVEAWVASQKGRTGKKALQEYARDLGVDPDGLTIGELRSAVVAAFTEQARG